MNSIQEYLKRTESAVKKIYEAIDSYDIPLHSVEKPTFVYWGEETDEVEQRFQTWERENQEAIALSLKSEKDFITEIFAMATLSGTILQFAHKAIEVFSENKSTHPLFKDIIAQNSRYAKFCIGREIDNIPLGLIVYAGRNQAQHYNDEKYGAITTSVFDLLANYYSPTFEKHFVNDYFDLSNPNLTIYAINIIWHLG